MKIEEEIGAKIRYYRKKHNLKIGDLAAKINKSSACISKYENGKIVLDVVTLYEIAKALEVTPEQLLYSPPIVKKGREHDHIPAFFQGISTLYMYYFDGRNNSVVRSVLEIHEYIKPGTYRMLLYMNFSDYLHFRDCEITYEGTLSHYDAVSNIILHNQNLDMDVYLVCIPSPYLNADTKWGQDFGISGRPIMPTSNKVLISKKIQEETPQFIKDLKVSKEDIRILKQYNMLTVL